MTNEARTPEDDPRPQAGPQPSAPEAASGPASPVSDEMSRADSETPPLREDASETAEAGDDIDRETDRIREESATYLDDLRRLKAEFDNYKKRMLREQTAMLDRASEGLIEKLLPVLDSFRLAIVAADRTKNDREFLRGVELVYGELLDVLRKQGLEEIDAEGKPFDPEVHEAVMQVAGAGVPDGHVAEVMRTGYSLKGRVIRPAMVSVNKG